MYRTALFEFPAAEATEIILEIAREEGAALHEVDWFISNRANIDIIETISSRLGVPREMFPVNLHKYGNSTGDSVLVALDEAISANMIYEGDLIVGSVFSGGLPWGANLIRIWDCRMYVHSN